MRENSAQICLAFKAIEKKVSGSHLYQRSARQRAPDLLISNNDLSSITDRKVDWLLNVNPNLESSVKYKNENRNRKVCFGGSFENHSKSQLQFSKEDFTQGGTFWDFFISKIINRPMGGNDSRQEQIFLVVTRFSQGVYTLVR